MKTIKNISHFDHHEDVKLFSKKFLLVILYISRICKLKLKYFILKE